MTQSVKSLDETISNLNTIISIQSEKELPVASLNVYNEINEVIEGNPFLINHSKFNINYDFERTFTVVTNAAYFDSIILNLITNVIQYKSPKLDPQMHISVYKIQNFNVIALKTMV